LTITSEREPAYGESNQSYTAETRAGAREAERQQEKTRRREEAKNNKTPTTRSADGEDPDIAGIIPARSPAPGVTKGDAREENEEEAESKG
jgi:hypothetical protein